MAGAEVVPVDDDDSTVVGQDVLGVQVTVAQDQPGRSTG
jgi:hypothetical protein